MKTSTCASVAFVLTLIVGGCANLDSARHNNPSATALIPTPSPDCGAIDPGFGLQDMTGASVEKARAIYDAAVACDAKALIRLAVVDQTQLSLGSITPQEAFAVPNPDDRYWAITRMLSLPPLAHDDNVPDHIHDDNLTWPYIDESTDLVDWDGPNNSGALSPEERRRLDASSWSINIQYDGTWTSMFYGE